MGIKKVLFGLAVLAGTASYIMHDPSLIHSGQQAVASEAGVLAAKFTSWTGGSLLQSAKLTGNLGKSKQTGVPTGSVGVSQTTSVVGNQTGNSGQKVSSVSTKGSTVGITVGAIQPQPIPITTNNAPPATPTMIDGVQMQYDPLKPSDGAYPDITGSKHLWIDVSISQQLAYLFDGDKLLYTFVTSSGLDTIPDNSTPLGVFHIQAQRGTWFFTQQYQMGAQYWVSWSGHGVFLFHSVPMNIDQQVIPKIAAELGQKASHGCFHLTIPDAKWVYDNIPYRTTVVVEDAPVQLQGKSLYAPSADQQSAELGGLLAGAAKSSGAATGTGTNA